MTEDDVGDISLNIISTPAATNSPKKVSSDYEDWTDKKSKFRDTQKRYSYSSEFEEQKNKRNRSRDKQKVYEEETYESNSEADSDTNLNSHERSNVITSLFTKNPEIPCFASRAVKPKSEAVFSSSEFKELSLHPFAVSNLEQNLGLQKLTTVQQKAIPQILSGCDALVRSQTGSGKTLAYALPIIEKLQDIRPKIQRSDGIQAVVVVPTRELALQTYEWFIKIVKPFTWIVPGYLIGGEKRKAEKARLRKGISVLIGTPGRLLDHIQHTKSLRLDYVKWLVLDEADRLLDMGYEKDIASFVEALKSHTNESPYQTILLSATLTNAVERLAGLTLKSPTFIDAADEDVEDDLVIPQSLRQYYLLTPAKLRLVTLSAIIKWKCQNSKMLIFVATQDMVDFHVELLEHGISGIQFFKLHGNMTQGDRMEVFKKFRSADSGVLLCTDVAARGLDLPKVHCIVQYTGPTTPGDYVHRVGRTARVGTTGDSILFLAPNEVQFLRQLEDRRIRLQEEKMEKCLEKLQEFANSSSGVEQVATELQSRYENAVEREPSLHDLASKAYVSWVRFYAGYRKEMREAFNFKEVHLGHYAKSFALRDPPSKIGGIGRKLSLQKNNPRQQGSSRGHGQHTQRWGQGQKRSSTFSHAAVSEFSSGLEPKKKKKKKK